MIMTRDMMRLQVLYAVGEKVEFVQYKNWIGYLLEGTFTFRTTCQAH